MSELKIQRFPEPILRKKAAAVGHVTQVERSILDDMAEIMYLSQGVGLAAVQVGIDKQMAVIDIGQGLIKMVDPVIINRGGLETQDEGCLSCPNVTVGVKRSRQVTVRFMNENGDLMELKASGLLARALQHEYDHIEGVTIVNRMGQVAKIAHRRHLKKLAEQDKEAGKKG